MRATGEGLGPAVHVHARLQSGLGLISKRGEREGELTLRLKTTRKRREKKNKRRRKKDKKRDSIGEKKIGVPRVQIKYLNLVKRIMKIILELSIKLI